MSKTTSPFSGLPFGDTPDAVREDCEIRGRAWAKPEKLCDVASKPKRKKVNLNPQQRGWFEKNGWTYARVEHANAFGAVNQDLWGFADYLACRPGEIVLVQVTVDTKRGGGAAAAHERKIRAAPEFPVWLSAGGRVEVHCWEQPGGPRTKWVMRIRQVTL